VVALDIIIFLLDTADQVVEVEDVLELIRVVTMHRMAPVIQAVEQVVVQLINGPVHHVLLMVVVEKLLLDGHNKIKSKNIIWDILQK
jgi:hypothetical protein